MGSTLTDLEEILPGIRVEPLPGHTWGIQGVFIDTPDHGTLVFPADMMPTAAHVHPAASMGYDMLPYEAMRTKLAFLERAVEGRWRLLLGHEPGDPLATVAGDQEAGFTLDCTPA